MKNKNNAPLFTTSVAEMSREERAANIKDNEMVRASIIARIEDVIAELSDECGVKKYKKRRFKLGKSPNDI